MKNFTKVKLPSLIALAVIMVLAACAPEVEITEYDWTEVNAQFDPARQGNSVATNWPSASIEEVFFKQTTATPPADDPNGITGFEIAITINETRADILRKQVTQADLAEFISFHHFTKAEKQSTNADTLGSAIPFTLEKTRGSTFIVKLTDTIDTTKTFSNLVMKVDGKKYTYARGLRGDVDNNGKIEDIYDDQYTVQLSLSTYTQFDPADTSKPELITGYNAPGQNTSLSITLPSVSSLSIGSEVAAYTPTPNPPNGNTFYFKGTEKTTNTNDWYFLNYPGGTLYGSSSADPNPAPTSAAILAYYKDLGDTYAKGIKLQKLVGETWTDVTTAVYDATFRDNSDLKAVDAGKDGNTYLVFKSVSFEHLVPYRIIWTGSAYTETTGTYFGVKQRVYINNSDAIGTPTGARRYTRTEVFGESNIMLNNNLKEGFIPNDFASIVISTSLYSCDSNDKNVVLKLELDDYYGEQFFWNKLDLATFKKSFQVYSTERNDNGITSADIINVEITNIDYKDEYDGGGAPVTAANPTGDNVVYIKLDPRYSIKTSEGEENFIYFRINNGVSVSNKKTGDDAQTYIFGDQNNASDNCFAAYGPVLGTYPAGHQYNPIPLYENQWVYSEISKRGEVWFVLNITSDGYYYFWGNGLQTSTTYGDGSQTLRYPLISFDNGSSLNGPYWLYYGNWNYQSFGNLYNYNTNKIKITPQYSGDTGTFGIVYSSNYDPMPLP